MALKFTRKPSNYISETAYAYDVAQTSKYFDKSVYETLAETGNNEAIQQYLFGVAGAGDKTSEYFNEHDYKYLSNEDKANYTIWSLYVDRDETDVDDQTGETYNVWERQKEYFDYKVQEGIDKETYNSLNSFQKTMSSIGGVVGNALNETLLGTVEGLVDLGAVIVGQKDWAAKDFTGVGANRELLQKYSRAYTYLDKNKFWKVSNDVVTGLAQMAPLAIPYVGSFIYFGAMAGNTAADAVRMNPDIDYLSLIGYTAAVTGVEYATEKLSAGIFGGSGTFIDNAIFKSSGKGLTKIGQKTMGNWVGRVGLNFLAEGFEESIAEFADTALFNVFIAQGDDALRKEYSIQDILYAGLIGGLIGGLGESGRIAGTTRLGLTQDGQLLSLQQAKQDKINIKHTLTKTQSLVAGEKMANAQRVLTKDALVDLKKKYSKLTLDEIKQQHSDEYNKALAKNTKTARELTEVVLGLNRIYELAGDKGFQKAAELANATFDVSRRLAQNYVNRLVGTEQNKKINIKVKKKYGNNTSFKVKDVLTAEEIRLKNNMKTFYGIDVFFGDLGTLDGENKKFGVTISESEIIIDSNQMGKMSEQALLTEIVKEELVHTLQFTKGLITPKTLKVIRDELQKQGVETQQQSLESAYAQDTALTKLTEAQAKAVAEVLLFDDLTINKMFRDDNKTFNGVYKVLNGIKNTIDKLKHFKTPKGKIKFNKVLKILKTYREAAARQFANETELNNFVKKYQLSDADEKELREIYLTTPDIGKIEGAEQMAFSKTGTSTTGTNDLTKFLRNKKNIKRLDLEDSGFSDEFVRLMESTNAPSITTLKDMLNDTTSGEVTAIGNEQRTNDIIEFLYRDNENIKTIEDVNKLLEKDKRGFSPLAYAYVYAMKYGVKEGVKITYATEEAAAKAKATRDPSIERNFKDIKFDLILHEVDGKRKVDKTKFDAKKSELKYAQDLIDSARKNNNINTKLLDLDFNFSINASKNLFKTLETDYETLSADETEIAKGFTGSIDSVKKTFKELEKATVQRERMENQKRPEGQFAIIESEDGEELGGEESVIDESSNVENIVAERMGETLDDEESIVERLPKVIKDLQTDLTEWAQRSGRGDVKENELNKLRLVVENVKDLSKSSKKINVSASTNKIISEVLTPDFAAKAVEDALTIDNASKIKKKLEQVENKKALVNMYGEVGYKQIHDVVTTFMKDNELTKTRKKSSENMEIALVKDSKDLMTDDVVETEEQTETIHERIDAIEGIVEDADESANELADRILTLAKSAAVKESGQQLTKDASKEYNVLHATMIVDSVFNKINEQNYDAVREKVAISPSTLTLFDEAMELATGANINNKYSQEFVDKVQHISRESITAGAQHIALQSKMINRVKPTTSIVKELKDAGYNVKITNEIAYSIFPQLENKQQLIKEYEKRVDDIKNEIEISKNDSLKLDVLSDELFNAVNTLKTLKNGTIEDLLDWAFNETRIFDGLNMEQKQLNTLFQKLLETSEKGEIEYYIRRKDGSKIPMTKFQKTLYKITKSIRNWRFWSMLCSPITFVRNWTTNTATKAHHGVVKMISDKITQHLAKRGSLYEGLHLYGEKSSVELRQHIMKNSGDYLEATAKGESKFNSDEGKRTHAIDVHKQNVKNAKNLFELVIAKGKTWTDWGLDYGPLGDQKFVLNALLDYVSRTIVNSKDYLMKDIKAEYDSLTAIKDSLTDKQKARYAVLEKAVKNSSDVDVFNALDSGTLSRIVDVCNNQAMKDYYKNSNALSKWVHNLSKNHPAASMVLETIVPFPKSGSNILNTIIDMTPLGFARAVGKFSNAKMMQLDLGGVSLKHALMDFSNDILGEKILAKEVMLEEESADGESTYKPSEKFTKLMNNVLNKHNADFMKYLKAHNEKYNGLYNMMSNEKHRKRVIDFMTNNISRKISDFDINDISVSQQEGIRHISNAAVGSFYMIAGAIFAALGWVDIEEDDYLGVCVNFNDTVRISLSDLSPIAGSFSMAAAFAYGVKNDKNGFKLALNTLYDNTLLGTVENIFRYSSPEKYAENLMISYVTSMIPAVLKLMNKLTSNGVAKDKSGNFLMRLVKSIGASIPGVSAFVPNKVNPYTGEKQRTTGTANWFFNTLLSLSPMQGEVTMYSDFEKEARVLDAETTGLSGKFTINKKEIVLTDKTKEKYSKYRAEYLNKRFNEIKSGKEKVTIKDSETGKFKTTTYDKLSTDEKNRVLTNLYSTAAEITKIQYWLNEGNVYVVTNKDQYYEYKKLFGSSAKIVYKKSWSTSKFVEG